MSKLFFISYADENYAKQLVQLTDSAVKSRQFDVVTGYTRPWLKSTGTYQHNRSLMDEPTYAGWAIFKSVAILDAFTNMQYNDILLYIDAGDIIAEPEGLRDFLLTKMQGLDMLLTDGAYPQKFYTKRDCFYFMKCESERFYDAIQIEAGILVVKKTAFSISVIQEWLKYCCDRRIVTHEPNVCGLDNFDGFVEGRADQSVMTNLAVKYNIARSNEMRRFIHCNMSDNR